jgi:hypothetical protein
MLTGITLENFKAFKEPQFIPIKPITLVFGPNGSGKSSIIHALAFLKHAHRTNGKCNPGRVKYGWSEVELGSWQNLVFGHDKNASMMIKLHTKNLAIEWRFENTTKGPKVASFLIEESGIATARGKNVGFDSIKWDVELHSSHWLWKKYKDALWSKLTDQTCLRSATFEDQEDALNTQIPYEETFLQESHFVGDCGKFQKDIFSKHFSKWLGNGWMTPPFRGEGLPFEGLFPRRKFGGFNENAGFHAPKDWTMLTRDQNNYFFDDEIDAESNDSESFASRNLISKIKKDLIEGSLTIQKSKEYFDCLHDNGSIGREDNELRVEAILGTFESHLHLGGFRSPPHGVLSKDRLSSEKNDHQPWLKLLVEDYDHDFYADPRADIIRSLNESHLPSGLVSEIVAAFDSGLLTTKWLDFRKKVAAAGMSDSRIQFIEIQYLPRDFDLPPLVLVNQGMKQIKIPYRASKRKRMDIAFRPKDEMTGCSGEEIEVESPDEELVFIDESGTAHSIHDLGSGVRVVIPVIVALSTAEVGLLSIEEPECHIHPRLQAELGDLLIKRSRWTYYEGPMHGQQYQEQWNSKFRLSSHLIVETHSEHLILRILRRIRETTECEMNKWPEALRKACPNGIRPEDVSVLYVEPGEGREEGSRVIDLPVTPDGDFSRPWPGGFFEERANELF